MCSRRLLAVLLQCSICICTVAQRFEADGIHYNITSQNENTAEVTYSNSTTPYSGSITIPEYVVLDGERYRVTAIKAETFWGCTGLAGVTLPGSITAIGDYMFYGCTGLASIIIPPGVTTIGKEAFAHCSGLENITLGENTENIGEGAFKHCTELTSVTIPHSTKEIGASAFEFCTALKEVHLGDGLATIGSSSFLGCSALEGIGFPNSLTSIGEFAFHGCTAMKKLHIPRGVIEIGAHAFNNCTALKEISIAEDNRRYDSRKGCNAIIETATNTLLQGCNNTLTPAGITSISDWAFHNCTTLKETPIPATTTDIGHWAFYNCDSITRVDIPQGTTTIGNGAFYECDNIALIHSYAEEPATIELYTFEGSYDKGTLYVPLGTRDTYVERLHWNRFLNIVEMGGHGGYDVNLDGTVDIADLTATTEMIATPSLATPAGDIDNNGIVDIADATEIAETIKHTQATADGAVSTSLLTAITEENVMLINIHNPEYPFSALQFDLGLPPGIETDNTPFISMEQRALPSHRATSHTLPDGTTRIIIYSPDNENFTNNEGAVAGVSLKVKDAVDNSYTFTIKNIKISSHGTKEEIDDYTGYITVVNGTLGINQPIVEREEGDGTIYDLSGRRVIVTSKGNIYIKNGKKFIAP